MNSLIRTFLAGAMLVLSIPGGAQAKGPGPILIGQTYVKTGPLADLSAEPLIGIQAMLAATNAAGGIHGRQVELQQLDDGSDGEKASANVNALVAQGAVALLMPIGTVSSVGALKAANELKVPLVGAYTGAAPAMKFSPYGFPVRIGFEEEYGRIVNHLFTIGITRIGVAYNDNPGARSAMESTKRFIEQRGAKMAGSVAIKQDGSDAIEKARELSASKPEAIVLSATNLVAGKFISAYRATGVQANFYSFSFLNGQSLYQGISNDAIGVVISQVVPYPWNSVTPVIVEYQRAMNQIGVKAYSYGSLEGYVSMKILVEALKRSGGTPTPELVKKSLETFKSHDLGGIFVKYTPTEHIGLSFSELSMVKKDGGYAR